MRAFWLGLVGVVFAAAALSACKKSPPSIRTPPPLKVAAAADLASAFKDVGEAYEKKTGQPVTFSFGSTGLLEKQIAEGAPYDVFAAANVSYADDAVKAGACFAETKSLYATGRLVMWTKNDEALPLSLEGLADPKFKKIAIANPEHAPYGTAAKQALTKVGVWSAVSSRIVYGENVQQTLAFAQSGNAEVAIVALSLALTADGKYTAIDASLYDRIDQALVVCKGGAGKDASAPSEPAKAFTAFVGSPDGHAIMRRHGFLMPGEATTSGDAGALR
ncbi:MAG: molybdate ABC transporter substrate-binding protein [Polyangiaceae bacterium]